MKKLLYLLPIFIFACSKPSNPTKDKAAIYQSYIDQLVARGQFNGNVLVAEEGQVVFRASVGLNSAEGDSLTLASQFRLASVSKQFTCAAIMQLKEQGSLAFDDPVQQHIPEWPYPATIRQLMHHTSGSPSYESLFSERWKPELAEDDPERLMLGNEHMVSFIVEHSPEARFPPGERYQYSNTAYVLLATIVSRVSGMPFEQYMREKVYLPAGLQNTYVYSPAREDPMTHRVYGFLNTWDRKERRPLDFHFLNAVAGDGGTYSTIDDLYTWNEVLYTDKVVTQATLEEAFQPAILNDGDTSWYGFGWGIDAQGKWGRRVSHGGSWVGFRTKIERMLDTKGCIVVLTNDNTLYLEDVVRGLRQIMLDGTYELPKLSAALRLIEVAETEGLEALQTEVERLQRDSANYRFVAWQMATLGYELLAQDRHDEALAFFMTNTEAFPGSVDAWDGLGDGHLASGDTAAAVESFEKALAIDEDRGYIREKVQGLVAP